MNSSLLGLPLDIGLVLLVWTPIFVTCTVLGLFPAWALREPLGQAETTLGCATERLRAATGRSDALGFARRLRTHRWNVGVVTSGMVSLLVTAAGLLCLLVAGNVVGLQRPAIAEAWLPWVLGGAVVAVVAETWPSHGDPRFVLRVLTAASGIVAVIIVAVLKAEASIVPPADYSTYHPFKDWLLGPFWVALEAAFLLGGAALGRQGLECGVRLLGWVGGLVIEGALRLAVVLIVVVLAVTRAALLVLRLLISASFLPAALIWTAIRSAMGTDLDGNPRLVGLPTGRQILKGDWS